MQAYDVCVCVGLCVAVSSGLFSHTILTSKTAHDKDRQSAWRECTNTPVKEVASKLMSQPEVQECNNHGPEGL